MRYINHYYEGIKQSESGPLMVRLLGALGWRRIDVAARYSSNPQGAGSLGSSKNTETPQGAAKRAGPQICPKLPTLLTRCLPKTLVRGEI